MGSRKRLRIRQLIGSCLIAVSIYMVCSKSAVYANEFNYHDMLITYVLISKDDACTKLVTDWMKEFRPEIWNQFQHDEFALKAKEGETTKIIAKDLQSYKINDPVTIHTEVQFGEFDFDKHAFELHPFTESHYFSVNRSYFNGLPQTLKISFSNPDILDGLPMADDKAQAFLNSRKSGGFVDRRLTAAIKIKPEAASGDYQMTFSIQEVKIMDPRNANRVIYTVPAAPSR